MARIFPTRDEFRVWLKDAAANNRPGGPATDEQADTLVRLHFEGMHGDDFIELGMLADDEYERMRAQLEDRPAMVFGGVF